MRKVNEFRDHMLTQLKDKTSTINKLNSKIEQLNLQIASNNNPNNNNNSNNNPSRDSPDSPDSPVIPGGSLNVIVEEREEEISRESKVDTTL